MKKKDKKPLFELQDDKLIQQLKDTKKEYLNHLMQHKIGKTKDHHLPKKKRKEIAILNTILRQKQILKHIKQKIDDQK